MVLCVGVCGRGGCAVGVVRMVGVRWCGRWLCRGCGVVGAAAVGVRRVGWWAVARMC